MREPGWYWLKSTPVDSWEVAHWNGKAFETTLNGNVNDIWFDIIGPKIEEPKESE